MDTSLKWTLGIGPCHSHSSLIYYRTKTVTYGDRVLSVAGSKLLNDLPAYLKCYQNINYTFFKITLRLICTNLFISDTELLQ